jgi:hypothetical protein
MTDPHYYAEAPWERQPGESVRCYQLFAIYRDLPPRQRSVRRVEEIARAQAGKSARPSGGPSGWIKRIAVRYRWLERALAWDEEIERRKREAALREAEEAGRRHIQYAHLLQSKAAERILAMRPDELSASEALRYLIEGVRIERQLLRGEDDP